MRIWKKTTNKAIVKLLTKKYNKLINNKFIKKWTRIKPIMSNNRTKKMIVI